MASVLLRALLIVAVVLMPLLTCPAASDAAPGIVGTSATSVGVAQVPHVLANLVSADDHHECHVLPVVTAAATGTLSGWAVAAAAVTVMVLAVCAMWRPRSHGPPRVQPHWVLSNGHERLVHFCVMRR
ncbi:hypothetical protein CCUG62472_05006 [Mycobacteroides salmoniphilum]|uniref:Lipoprotein LpqS n=2 Tax=Mycobacteroides salmoniphilum TaxID=404941 RepID=A0A4R8SUH4_9MYCO|nr:hypothetical protein CCUG62472_05006 [Mycobacteroides salmoniphilum]TEA04145.1 hypothetical protein CCUG60884_03009 [Mycobacteroides salmoniphilum]